MITDASDTLIDCLSPMDLLELTPPKQTLLKITKNNGEHKRLFVIVHTTFVCTCRNRLLVFHYYIVFVNDVRL